MELNGESREISPPYFPISLKIDVELISLPYRPIEFVMDLASIDFVVIVPRNWPSSATMIAPSSSANDDELPTPPIPKTALVTNFDSQAFRERSSWSLSFWSPLSWNSVAVIKSRISIGEAAFWARTQGTPNAQTAIAIV